MLWWVSICVLLATVLATRILLIWRTGRGGCDAYYYLLCVEEYRKKRKLPIALPDYYLMDITEQWYPPGFTIFLSWIPDKWLSRNYWLVTPVLDYLTTALVFGIAYWSTSNATVSILASVTYALAYPALTECRSLNSRPLGNLLLAAFMTSLVQYTTTQHPLWLALCLLFGFLTVMTHKMSAQFIYFALPAMSLVFWNPIYILVLFSVIGLSFLSTRRLFWNMLRGQWDILMFWRRNWPNLGAHQVRSSPVYGNENRFDRGRIFRRGWHGITKNTLYLGANVFVVMIIFVIVRYNDLGLLFDSTRLALFDRQMLWWVILTYALAGITLFIPHLGFYGEGYKYLRMAAFPIAYLTSCSLIYGGYQPWQAIIYLSAFVGALFLIRWRLASNNKTLNPEIDADLDKVLEYLKRDEVNVVLSIPTHLMDMVVYHCRKSVVWGTHSYNFKEVEPMFPIFRKPLEWFADKYNITHVLIDRSYCLPHEIGMEGSSRVLASGTYEVHKLDKGVY